MIIYASQIQSQGVYMVGVNMVGVYMAGVNMEDYQMLPMLNAPTAWPSKEAPRSLYGSYALPANVHFKTLQQDFLPHITPTLPSISLPSMKVKLTLVNRFSGRENKRLISKHSPEEEDFLKMRLINELTILRKKQRDAQIRLENSQKLAMALKNIADSNCQLMKCDRLY